METRPTVNQKLSQYLVSGGLTILDGALATYLEKLGADISNALWSAEILINQPDLIRQAHLDYFRAGANVAITASYQASLAGLTKHTGMQEAQAKDLIRRSVELAQQARDDYIAESSITFDAREEGQGLPRTTSRNELFIAGSVGPYGAWLADGSEYRGDYVLSKESMKLFHRGRIEALVSAGVDLVACETMPSKCEIEALIELLQTEFPKVEAWFSLTLKDSEHMSDDTPIKEVVALFDNVPKVIALGFNCVPNDVALGALKILQPLLNGKALILYPNSGESWNAESRGWEGRRSEGATLAMKAIAWYNAGARLIGGCCRTTPEDIIVIREALASFKKT